MSKQTLEPMIYYGDITGKSIQDSRTGKSIKVFDDFQYDPKDLDNTDQHYERIVEGLANTPIADRVNDMVSPEAFNESLIRYKSNPILRRNHKTGEVIGRVIGIEPRAEGLWIKARIFKGVEEAEKAWKLILQGGLQAFSVYGVIKEKQQKQQLDGKMVQHVTKFDLQEIAVVDIPANPDSLFRIVAKSVDNMADDKTEKANDPSQTDQLNQTEPKKEVGNEPISTDSTVEKMLNQIASFQQKTLEVLVTLAESNTSIVEKLGEIGQDIVAKDAEDEFADEEFEDEGFEDEEEFKSAPADTSDLEKRLETLVAKYAKDEVVMDETSSKILEENEKLKKQVEELSNSQKAEEKEYDHEHKYDEGSNNCNVKDCDYEKEEKEEKKSAEELRDKNLETAVQKAVSKVSTEASIEEVTEKSDPLRNMIVAKLMKN